jgi:putative membrane-bound dehydrogenase-like protein
VVDGFSVELFAAEPLIADPVDMEIDEQGRLYVLENHGYPLDTGTSSRIKILFDTEGDGRPDQAEVFADSLKMPTGIMRWKRGVIVTDAPDVIYLADTDGDHRADIRRVILTGFSFSNPQHNMSAPVYGLDNWIYIANEGSVGSDFWPEKFGGEGKEIRFPRRDEGPVLPRNGGNQNVRFRPDSFRLQTISGRSQFGQAFDRWGRHFLVHNTNIIYRAELDAHYLRRNPDLVVSDITHTLSEEGPMPEVYPITEDPEFAIFSDVGVITSASGLTLYQDDLFPEQYRDVSFVGENAHNLVHATSLSPSGMTFTARRIPEDQQFLASRDRWFRPVNFYVGPEGGLYMLDYYREYIEHPEWLSEDLHDSDALYNGWDRGRIYRIVPEDAQVSPLWGEDISLGEMSTERLVETLERSNAWGRRTAQRLLVDRDDPASVEPLQQLVRESSSAVGRLHALWTLEGLDVLDPSTIRIGLKDSVAGVRENAIKLAELHLENHPGLADALVNMADDPDERVRFQLLCTLGEVNRPEARDLHRQLLFEHIDSQWMQLAGLTAVDLDPLGLFRAAVARFSGEPSDERRQFFRRVSSVLAAGGDRGQITALVERIFRERSEESVWWQAAALEGIARGVERTEAGEKVLFRERLFMADDVMRTERLDLRRAYLDVLETLGLPMGPSTSSALERAATAAADSSLDPELRVDALRLLGIADPSARIDLFKGIIRPEEPTAVQRAAVRNLVAVERTSVAAFLLERWNQMTPAIREAAMPAFMGNEAHKQLLLDAVETGRIHPSTIGWSYRVRLMRGASNERARVLLKRRTAEREDVLEEYAQVLDRSGDPARGEKVFRDACARCHARGSVEGGAFGPDLSSVRNRSEQWMLTQILMPNRSIADNYEQWTIERAGGRTLTGIISAETATSVTVMNIAGEETTVPRTEIVSMSAVGASAMPAGLERQIDSRQMADLLAFLKGR